ncbi:hypothetical protein Hypma_012179 [Hypsizygus marmoreus]|uniref:Uncharacterized protein n=1 Tax=Hypsizygus marmoreus TaxID=39966 RepID=A0A369JHT6_HYPMA|nr:hypothetical protein Hypma_012179 [Hypsizygus marmoreus]
MLPSSRRVSYLIYTPSLEAIPSTIQEREAIDAKAEYNDLAAIDRDGGDVDLVIALSSEQMALTDYELLGS